MPENFNSNSFAPFLETITRSTSKSKDMSQGPGNILQALAAAPNKRMEMPSLLSASDLPIDAFANTLKDLESAGLLVTQTENGRQIAILNPVGEQVARVNIR